MSPGLITRDLSFAYGAHPVISGLSLSIPVRGVTGIVGPNGCGKSTLVALLARLNTPHAGKIELDGADLASYGRRDLARRIAYLPQLPVTPRGITVSQVLRYGRHPHQSLFRQFSREDAERIDGIAERLDLGSVLERRMDELSGGQRQRAWLGMTLVQDTPYVLLDEPTSALDIGHQYEVLEVIRAMRDEGKTVVLVIHDLAAATRFCDHLVALKDGTLRRAGPPEQVVTPDLIRDLYELEVDVWRPGETGPPVIVPKRRRTERTPS
jgi:iron complex transport system ATP-binding protein